MLLDTMGMIRHHKREIVEEIYSVCYDGSNEKEVLDFLNSHKIIVGNSRIEYAQFIQSVTPNGGYFVHAEKLKEGDYIVVFPNYPLSKCRYRILNTEEWNTFLKAMDFKEQQE